MEFSKNGEELGRFQLNGIVIKPGRIPLLQMNVNVSTVVFPELLDQYSDSTCMQDSFSELFLFVRLFWF